MIISWLTYAVVVGALVSVAAWLAERGARAQRWPTRWVWTGAMAASVGGPLVAWLLPTAPAAAPVVGAPGAYVLGSLSTLTAGSAGPSGPSPETLVLVGWGALSAVLLATLCALAIRLERRGRRWPRRMVDGVEVLVSRRTGPAAMGVLRGRVVVPEWALRLEARQRRLLVLHEAEHVRARDPQLALAALVVCILAPWNLALWWQLQRLRLAIEMDCDARVLRRSPDPRTYGALLVTVGQRRAHLAVALVESRNMLERRIRMIMNTTRARATVRAGALAVVAGLVLAVACETPGPTETTAPAPVAPEPATTPGPAGSVEDLSDGPVFTPMTVRPQLRNPEEVQAAILDRYPPLLRDAGIGGTVSVWFLVDETGRVAQRQINLSSGRSALDMAAIDVADRMMFSPAYNGDEPVPVWVAIDIRFDTEAEEEQTLRAPTLKGEPIQRTEREEREIRQRLEESADQMREEMRSRREQASRDDVAEQPTFTPMTEQPRLKNGQETADMLQRYYPPLLKDAGIEGTASVWFFIDENGQVADVRINESSGHQALDEAALAVAREMEFAPAQNRDERVAVWVALDITFEVQ